MLAESSPGPVRAVLKCLRCDLLFVGAFGSTPQRVFTGSLEKGFSPTELFKWKTVNVDEAAVCPGCSLSVTPPWKRLEREAHAHLLSSVEGGN